MKLKIFFMIGLKIGWLIFSWGCESPPPSDDGNCGGLCGPGAACINGFCILLRDTPTAPTVDLEVQPNSDAERLDVDQDIQRPEDAEVIYPEWGAIQDAIVDIGFISTDLEPFRPCQSEPERCDDVDNDCDGLIDEDDPAFDEECFTGLPGSCASGRTRCDHGALTCFSAVSPRAELCDGVDNDCNGEVDDEVLLSAEREGACSTGLIGVCNEGAWACHVGEWVCASVYAPSDELCDGLDNDCDGSSDESPTDILAPCDTGALGLCAQGQSYCADGGFRCSQIFPATDEVCDGEDNDCDGVEDESFPEEEQACPTEGLGLCSAGIGRCIEGELICQQEEERREELCDDRDDDCDGRVDESYDRLGELCEVGLGICMRSGQLGCSETGDGYACQGEEGTPEIEVCDTLDNDCDGVSDNLSTPPQTPLHCGACGRECVLSHGAAGCVESECVVARCDRGWVDFDQVDANGCERACLVTESTDEVCDGLDNDCDGLIDGPEICQGDAFRFCRTRAEAGRDDLLCEGFQPGRFARSFWAPSRLGGGLVEQLDGLRTYKLIGPSTQGGGHTRRIPRVGPTFTLGVSLTASHPLAISIGAQGLSPAVPTVGGGLTSLSERIALWRGYALWIQTTAEGVELQVRTVPGDESLWTGSAPSLDDAQRHWLEWSRDATGLFSLSIDGLSLTPSTEAEPDHQLERFDEITFYFEPLPEGQSSSEIDAFILQEDRDEDGIPPRVDNCPMTSNPDQIDLDHNGVGAACDDRDGDGLETGVDPCPLFASEGEIDEDSDGVDDRCDFERPLFLGIGRTGPKSGWLFDLKTAHLWRPAPLPVGVDSISIGHHEPVLWTQYNSVYALSPEGDVELRAAQRVQGDWLGERLIYHDVERRVLSLQRTEFEVDDPIIYQVPPGGELYGQVSVDEEHVIVVSRIEGDVYVEIFDDDGTSLGPQTLIPAQENSALTKVDWHPEVPSLLVGGETGEARGISIINPSLGSLTAISDRPTSHLRFTPDGEGFVALHPDENGRVSLVLYRDLEGLERVTLIDSASWLSGDVLDWGSPRNDHPDRDGDGVLDDTDLCPTLYVDLFEERSPLHIFEEESGEGSQGDIDPQSGLSPIGQLIPLDDLEYKSLTLTWTGQDYLVAWTQTVNGAHQGRMLRLSRSGEVLQDFGEVSRCRQCDPLPQPVWWRDEYQLIHLFGEEGVSGEGRLGRLSLNTYGELGERTQIGSNTRLRNMRAYPTSQDVKVSYVNFDNIIRGYHINDSLTLGEGEEINTGLFSQPLSFTPLSWVSTPDGSGASVTLDHVSHPIVSSEGISLRSPTSTASLPIASIGVNDDVWVAYTSSNQSSLWIRRFRLDDELFDRPIQVIGDAVTPSLPKLTYNGVAIEVYWLQMVNARRVLFHRRLSVEGAWLSTPSPLSDLKQNVGRPEASLSTPFDVTWDGQTTAVIYPIQGRGLFFQRGDIQCW
jgi:hypothetical protein